MTLGVEPNWRVTTTRNEAHEALPWFDAYAWTADPSHVIEFVQPRACAPYRDLEERCPWRWWCLRTLWEGHS